MVVAVAEDHDGGSLRICRILGRNIASMDLEITVTHDGGVFEDVLVLEGIVPSRAAGAERVGLMAGALNVGNAMGLGS